jgi:SAM-dependent methyltransferase
MMSMIRNITAPYSGAEAWLYDRFIAPAIVDLLGRVGPQLERELPEGAEILDVGCGGGQVMAFMAARHPAAGFVGLDLSPQQVARARERTRALGDRISVVEGSALELPFADGRFDLVYSCASIKHWPDPAQGLGECVRVLKPGGRLLVIEVDRGCRYDEAADFVGRWRLPRLLRTPNLLLFRLWVAGRSLDLLEARELATGLPLEEWRVERIEETPAFMLEGRKR